MDERESQLQKAFSEMLTFLTDWSIRNKLTRDEETSLILRYRIRRLQAALGLQPRES